MKYVILKRGTKVLIRDDQVKAIDDALCDDDVDIIRINDLPYARSAISHFEEAPGVVDPTIAKTFGIKHVIESGCRGQRSIHLAIIGLASKAHDLTLMNNAEWVDEQRQKLWAKSDNWCDHTRGSCACKASYRPSSNRLPAGAVA